MLILLSTSRSALWFALAALLAASAAPAETPDAATLLKRGHALIVKPGKAIQLKAARMLEKGWSVDKRAFDGLVGASRASFIRAYWETDRPRAGKLARRGWKLAKVLIKRWPDRAEGYYWAAVNIGRYATTLSVMDAVNQGVVGKIERHALAALKRDPSLYQGEIQVVLGRYYFQLPWPMQKLDESVEYLREALRQNPDHTYAMLYLGESLKAADQPEEAAGWFRRCAARKSADPVAAKKCADLL